MSEQNHYYRVGVFILTGLVLLCIAILLFGKNVFFGDKGALFETFFNESVQGLEIGSPVKIRGVKFAQVERIEMAGVIYPETTNAYIRVVMRGNTSHIQHTDGSFIPMDEESEAFSRAVATGLRLRQASAGITGGTYIEGDFISNPRDLPLDFEPQYTYCPSQPSMKARLNNAAEDVMDRLNQTPFDTLARDLDKLVVSLDIFIQELTPSIRQTESTISNLATSVEGLTRDFHGMLEEDIQPVLRNFKQASNKLPGTMASLENTLWQAKGALAEVNMGTEELRINLQDITLSTRMFMEKLNTQPGSTLLGKYPKPLDVLQPQGEEK